MKPFVQGLAEVKPHDPFEEAQTGSKPQAHPSKGPTILHTRQNYQIFICSEFISAKIASVILGT